MTIHIKDRLIDMSAKKEQNFLSIKSNLPNIKGNKTNLPLQ